MTPFTMHELRKAIGRMKNRKCGDQAGLVADMFKHASDDFYSCLLECYNDMLCNNYLDLSWRQISFSLLPNAGHRKKSR